MQNIGRPFIAARFSSGSRFSALVTTSSQLVQSPQSGTGLSTVVGFVGPSITRIRQTPPRYYVEQYGTG